MKLLTGELFSLVGDVLPENVDMLTPAPLFRGGSPGIRGREFLRHGNVLP